MDLAQERRGAVPLEAVFFDRDGTLVVDVPYNGDPDRVALMPTVREAVGLLRDEGLRVGVVSNQSGIGRGILSAEDVARVNARIEALLGSFDVWEVCPHLPEDGCACRKPKPGMVLSAAERLGVDPSRVAVVGDIGSDVRAAEAAGSRGVLVPTPVTRPHEVRAASAVAPTVLAAVRALLAGRRSNDRLESVEPQAPRERAR